MFILDYDDQLNRILPQDHKPSSIGQTKRWIGSYHI